GPSRTTQRSGAPFGLLGLRRYCQSQRSRLAAAASAPKTRRYSASTPRWSSGRYRSISGMSRWRAKSTDPPGVDGPRPPDDLVEESSGQEAAVTRDWAAMFLSAHSTDSTARRLAVERESTSRRIS